MHTTYGAELRALRIKNLLPGDTTFFYRSLNCNLVGGKAIDYVGMLFSKWLETISTIDPNYGFISIKAVTKRVIMHIDYTMAQGHSFCLSFIGGAQVSCGDQMRSK